MSYVRNAVLFFGMLAALAGWVPRVAAQPTWTAQNSGTTQDLWTVNDGTYSNPIAPYTPNTCFIAAGTGGTILTSQDAIRWTPLNSPTTVWLVASVRGIIVGDQGTILQSSDGLTWTLRAGGNSGASRLNGIATGNGLVLAVGENGTVVRSTDNGVTWVFGNSGFGGWLRGIAYNPASRQFLICGQAGTLLSTPDGVSFTALQSGTTSDLEALGVTPVSTYVEAVLVGANGYLASSLDGVHWTSFIAPSMAHFRGVAMTSATSVAVGSSGDTAFAFFNPDSSSNAISGKLPDLWEEIPSGSGADLYGVTVGGVIGAVAVGEGGAIFTTPAYQGYPTVSNVSGPAASAYGQTVTLSVTPTGQPPLSYQWTFNGQPISGATQPSLTLPAIGPAQNGQYALTVSNVLGSSQTTSYTLAGVYQPAIPGLVDESYTTAEAAPDPVAVILQPDGKVVLGGIVLVTRLNPDGTPDTAFNTAAAAINQSERIPVPGFNHLLLQKDGKLIVGGAWGAFEEPIIASSWRLNSDGSLDPTYTPGGAAIQLNNGQFVTAGVTRLNNDGTPDSTFTAFYPPGAPSGVFTMVKDSTGGVVVAISTNSTSVGFDKTYICRLNPDGTYNSAFAPQILNGSLVAGPLILSGQNIVVLTNELGNASGKVTTYHLRGVGFNYARIDIPSSPSLPWSIPTAVAGSDGSVYLYLSASSAPSALPIFQGTYRNGIIRIDPSGNFDPSYSLNIPLGPASSLIGLISTPTNQWIAWGTFVLLNGETHNGIARLNPQIGTNFASLANISARAQAGQGTQALDVGITTSGPTNLPVLLRGIGPALAPFGVTRVLADPELTLYSTSGAALASDDNWSDNGQGPTIAAVAQAVGAFSLPTGSLDAAALASLTPGAHSFVVQGVGGGAGNALAELYDTSPGTISYGAPRPINLSFRAPVGTGAGVLTAGFVLGGGNTKHILIRAIGPGLAAFGLTGTVPDPVLSLYSGNLLIASSQNWSANATQASLLAATFADVGAFALPAGSADAALTLDLSPGDYTVQASSASGMSGVALVEVYEVP